LGPFLGPQIKFGLGLTFSSQNFGPFTTLVRTGSPQPLVSADTLYISKNTKFVATKQRRPHLKITLATFSLWTINLFPPTANAVYGQPLKSSPEQMSVYSVS